MSPTDDPYALADPEVQAMIEQLRQSGSLMLDERRVRTNAADLLARQQERIAVLEAERDRVEALYRPEHERALAAEARVKELETEKIRTIQQGHYVLPLEQNSRLREAEAERDALSETCERRLLAMQQLESLRFSWREQAEQAQARVRELQAEALACAARERELRDAAAEAATALRHMYSLRRWPADDDALIRRILEVLAPSPEQTGTEPEDYSWFQGKVNVELAQKLGTLLRRQAEAEQPEDDRG